MIGASAPGFRLFPTFRGAGAERNKAAGGQRERESLSASFMFAPSAIMGAAACRFRGAGAKRNRAAGGQREFPNGGTSLDSFSIRTFRGAGAKRNKAAGGQRERENYSASFVRAPNAILSAATRRRDYGSGGSP